MDISTAKILVGAALIIAIGAFSLITLASAASEMIRDLRSGRAAARPSASKVVTSER